MTAIATDQMDTNQSNAARTVPHLVLCTSCASPEALYASEDPDQAVLCWECRSPLITLAFPKYYCDLGGQG